MHIYIYICTHVVLKELGPLCSQLRQAQLAQSQLELRDASSRSEAAMEQLRKVALR